MTQIGDKLPVSALHSEDALKSLESKLAQRDEGIERLQEEKLRPKLKLSEAPACTCNAPAPHLHVTAGTNG